MTITFWVPGLPAPGGSKQAFIHPTAKRKDGKPLIVVKEDCARTKDWRTTVSTFAWQAMQEQGIKEPLRCPVRVDVRFYLPRPKGHYGTGRNAGILKRGAPAHHTIRTDATKLWRAAEDSLRQIAWCDDAQVWRQVITKTYTEENDPALDALRGRPAVTSPGAQITIRTED